MAQKFTGYIGDLSEEQEAVKNEIIAWVRQTGILDLDKLRFDQADMLRFCRARKFEVEKVKAMITSFSEWRQAENIDTLYETWHWPNRPAFHALYPYGVHKTCKLGRPIQIERPGVANINQIMEDFTPEEIIGNMTWQCEWYRYLITPACERAAGRPIESCCQIFDLTDGNVRKLMSRNCLALLKMGAKVAQDYYPETMGACYVVNAPMLFAAMYAIVKGFLDERTRSKVRIIGSNYQPVLLEAIGAENLPDFLGGTCTCSHVEGGCLSSEAGPWNDYVVVNKMIKHKDEIEEEKKEEEEERAPVADLEFPSSAAAAAAAATGGQSSQRNWEDAKSNRDGYLNQSCDLTDRGEEISLSRRVSGRALPPAIGALPESQPTFFRQLTWYQEQLRY